MIFAGVDWAEAHHDVCVMSEDGRVLEQRRVGDSVAGIGELHALIAAHAEEGELVAAGIEVDRGLVVTALLAAGSLASSSQRRSRSAAAACGWASNSARSAASMGPPCTSSV